MEWEEITLSVEWLREQNGRVVPRPFAEEGGLLAICLPYLVTVTGERVCAYEVFPDGTYTQLTEDVVKSYGGPFYKTVEEWLRQCGDEARTGWIRTDWGERIIYLYDHREEREIVEWPNGDKIAPEDRGYYTGGNFGYGLNLDVAWNSEWGYASVFPMHGESEADMYRRSNEQWEAMIAAFGGPEHVAVIEGPKVVERS